MTDFDPTTIYNNNPLDTSLDTLTYIQSFLDRLNHIHKSLISPHLNIQLQNIKIGKFNPDYFDPDTLFISNPDNTTTPFPIDDNTYYLEVDMTSDLLILLNTTDPNNIILSIDTQPYYYTSIDNFLLNFLTFDIIHNTQL